MREVYLYIAMTLDGFISDNNGSVSFLDNYSDNLEILNSYNNFIEKIDTVILGYNTYEKIVNELSVDVWPYDELYSYVFTHRSIENKKYNIEIVNRDIYDFIYQLKHKNGKGIWICGGANIINQLIRSKLIDKYYISVIPKILGSGIRLFDDNNSTLLKLNLINTKSYNNGIVDLIYSSK